MKRLKVPASRAVWLRCAEREDCLWDHLVDIPGRWACARGAVFSRESPALDRSSPSPRTERLGYPLEGRLVRDLLGLPLQHEIEGPGRDRDRAPSVSPKILGLASPVPR